ncbi:hypothetical protein PALA30_01668 [Pseudomonas aeruginosa]|nr:hypothetical protein PALA30_01668 [Pseudomonas aeruginosa]
MRTPAWLGSGMPLLFVLLWSTGFLGAKFGLPYAEPFTFLAIRLLLAAALLAAFALLSGAPWPGMSRSPACWSMACTWAGCSSPSSTACRPA